MAKLDDQIAVPIKLDELLLDAENPRFGGRKGGLENQKGVLDHIVSEFGVQDVMSSLAVNGYFKAEPLVGRREGDRFVIVEGNRRLAACLILTGDERASNQVSKCESSRALWKKHGEKPIDPVPVIVLDGDKNDESLLSYLGVRHISASAPWDSFAKAHWAAQVVENTKLTVSDISTMIGDNYRTVSRLLEGYYVVEQAVKTGHFEPRYSVRRGRGSVSEYPFSWVYTIIGYSAARNFLGLQDEGPSTNPIPEENLSRIKFLLYAMFGDAERGRNSVLKDSRELGDLANALSDRKKVALLEQGMSLEEVLRQTKPIADRLSDNLFDVRRFQSELITVLNENPVTFEVANENLPTAEGNKRTANAIEKILRDIVFPEAAE